jgi:hypothetical protein
VRYFTKFWQDMQWVNLGEWANLKESVARGIAFHLPREVAYWAAIRVGAHATQGKWGMESPSSLLLMTALKRWRETI